MLRFGRIFECTTAAERRRLDEFRDLFRRVFPREAEQADRLVSLVGKHHDHPVEVLLLTAENERGKLIGFAYAYVFPQIRYAFLDYIASAQEVRHRGIGGSLYEILRESLDRRRVHGLFLECPPDDPAAVTDPTRLEGNRRRVAFYERFGARAILGTAWNDPPERLDYDPPLLIYDPLGRDRPLPRADARKAVRAILETRYSRSETDPFVLAMASSFRDDPVRLRPPRHEPSPPVPPTTSPLEPLTVVVPVRHEIHHVRDRGYVEKPARVGAILRGLEGLRFRTRPPERAGRSAIRLVHDSDLVAYLDASTAALGPDETIYPQVFPIRRPERKPKEMAMRAGYYCIDTFTPLSRSAYDAARSAVDCATTAAACLRSGDHLVYGICRPPGHHAERRVYGGFCYFNNAAIAAAQLATDGRVALLDLDYHHGNGQQDIFYERPDILTVSIHGHPQEHYPYFSGYSDEVGTGEGRGHNRNFPIRDVIGDTGYLEVLQKAITTVEKHQPMWLIVSLGFDTMHGDPTGNFGLTVRGLRRIGEALGRTGLPTLVLQEGGYSIRNLTRGARAFFAGLTTTWYG